MWAAELEKLPEPFFSDRGKRRVHGRSSHKESERQLGGWQEDLEDACGAFWELAMFRSGCE